LSSYNIAKFFFLENIKEWLKSKKFQICYFAVLIKPLFRDTKTDFLFEFYCNVFLFIRALFSVLENEKKFTRPASSIYNSSPLGVAVINYADTVSKGILISKLTKVTKFLLSTLLDISILFLTLF
jgi:hypothetical protein